LQLIKSTDKYHTNTISKDASSSRFLIKYIKNIISMNESTAKQYTSRLQDFANFVYKTYECSIDTLIDKLLKDSNGKKPKIDLYDILSEYTSYLTGTIAPTTIKSRIVTVKNFFEYCGIEINPRKFKLRVKLPKSVKNDKEALSKDDIVNILNACSSMRLKTYVMLLSATGMRATEALSIRLCDLSLNTDFPKVFVRGEYTKTRSDRTVFLTQEVSKQLKNWLEYKFRTRRVSFYDKNTGKSISEHRTPSKVDNDLIFSMNASSRGYLSVSIYSLYVELASAFGKTLEHLGRGQREESPGAQHRKITLHSMRRYVKSTITDLGYYDYSEWFIGHSGSTYYRKSEKEKAEIFKKIEPYLTFLDVTSLERIGSDTQARLEEMQMVNEALKQRNTNNTDAIANMQKEIENMKTMVQTLMQNSSKVMDLQQQTALVKSMYESGWLKEQEQ
jgi:integrase